MLKKSMSLFVICCQLTVSLVATGAFAEEKGTVNAELSLLETVLMLKSLGLKQQDLDAQVQGAAKAYDAAAPQEGRAERMKAAMVEMKLMSPRQAERFVADATAGQAAIEAQKGLDSAEKHNSALRAQLDLLGKINPVGAQFSACALGWTLGAAGAATAIVGLVVAFNNPTCHNDYNHPYDCSQQRCNQGWYDSAGYYHNGDCYYEHDTCYPTTCDVPGYYPDRKAGNITMIAGGVVAAAGIAILLIDRDSCF